MRGESQYSPTTPRESVDNGGWEIPFGVVGVHQSKTETVIKEIPPPENCTFTPDQAAAIVKPDLEQITNGVILY
jgi:hypothetical protein